MASIGKIVRRTFLFGSLAVAGGVALGVWYVRKPAPNPLRPAEGETALNAFVVIDNDGVTLVAPRAEMGQGVQTTWAALLAEEMDLAWDQVRVIHGPPATAYFNNAMTAEGLPNKGYDISSFQHSLGEVIGSVGKVFDLQITGGSTSMRDGYERMRATGAAAREILKAAAANRLGVDKASLSTENGTVIAPDGTTFSYSELAPDTVDLDPGRISLRPREAWTLLGTALPRLDMVAKVTGTAEFGIDTRLPGMRYAAIRMAPDRGGMTSFRDRDALKLPGVEKVVDLGDGVAVIANNTWIAQRALDTVEITWANAIPHPATTEEMFAAIEAGFDLEPNSTMRDDGDVTAPQSGATPVNAEYRVPFLAHATMEPMNATAWLEGGTLRVWCGTQSPIATRDACAAEAGVSEESVDLTTTFLGGGFGRRGEQDYAILATRVAKAMPGTPVNVTWSREEDMTHDFYRPGAIARMSGAVANGRAVLLDGAVSSPSATQQAFGRWMGFTPGGPDRGIVDGMFNQPYDIPNFRVNGHIADLDTPIGFWRSVGYSFNGFFMESFVDEMAHAAGADPLAFRKTLTLDEWEPALTLLETVQEMSNWTGETPANKGRGVALCYSFGTPVAMVIEVEDQNGLIRLTDAWIAVDPGVALDPGIIETQLTGGMAFGLSAAIGEEITFTDGIVDQKNFPDYEPLRISQMPRCHVRIVEMQEHIGGIGEVGTPPAAAALANALFDLTGKRVRELPLNKHFEFYV